MTVIRQQVFIQIVPFYIIRIKPCFEHRESFPFFTHSHIFIGRVQHLIFSVEAFLKYHLPMIIRLMTFYRWRNLIIDSNTEYQIIVP